MLNLPSGTTPADIDRQFGERDHDPQCPQRESWKPAIDELLGVAYEVVNVWDETREWTSANETRLRAAIEELRGVLEPACQCDQLAQAYADDAAEQARDEDEGR